MSENLKVNAQPRASIDVVVSLNDSKSSTSATKATQPSTTPKPNKKVKLNPRKPESKFSLY